MVRVNVDNVDVCTGKAVKYSPVVMAMIQELTTPYFVRTMYNSMVFAGSAQRHGGYHMELPAKFVTEHGDKIHRCVNLEGPSGEMWEVRVKIALSQIQTRVSFSSGWREFSLAHKLERGDLLLFSVVAYSEFVVSIFSHAGTLVHRRQSVQGIRRCGEVLFPSHVLKFPEDEPPKRSGQSSSPQRSDRVTVAKKPSSGSGPKGSSGKNNNLKSCVKPKSEHGRSKPKRRSGGERYSDTEVFKMFEEVVRGEGEVSRLIDGKLVKWEKVEDRTTMSTCDELAWDESPQQPGDPTEVSPGRLISTGTDTEIHCVSDDEEENASWPTWMELFGFQEHE